MQQVADRENVDGSGARELERVGVRLVRRPSGSERTLEVLSDPPSEAVDQEFQVRFRATSDGTVSNADL